MAYVGNIPYNPATDPKALFVQGLKNYMAGLNQRLDSRRFGKALGEVDPQASLLQSISQMLTGGATPEQAMGVGNMMQRGGAGRLGTLPGWWAFATPQQQQDYMNRVGGPLVQVGPKLLTPQQRQDLADKGYKEEMGLTSTQLSNARKGVKTIVREMGHGTWLGDMKGFKNFKRDNLIAGYKQYRIENDYASKSEENKKKLDDVFDSQMNTYNKAGYGDHGKGEFDWDPNDERVQALRKETPPNRKGDPANRQSQSSTRDPWMQGGSTQALRKNWDRKTAEESPYEDYPDAFKEDGVWKVIRGGKKYKVVE